GARGGRLRGGGRSRRRRRRARPCAPPSTAGRAARRLAARHERLRRRGRARRRLEPGRSRFEQKRGRARRRHEALDRPRLHHEERADGGRGDGTPRRRTMRFVRLAILLGGVLLAVAMYRGATNEDLLSPGKAAVHYASFLLAIFVSLLVWELRPDPPIGPLLTALTFLGVATE